MWNKPELAVEVLEGIAIHTGEKKKDYEARVGRIVKDRQELSDKELAEKEFKNLKSICLTCKNAFVESYIENPQQPDPTDVVCKKKLEIWGSKAVDIFARHFAQCEADKWNRKTLRCSDYEERI